MENRTCSIPGCHRQHEARGWCAAHYQRWKRHGDPLMVDPERALAAADPETRFRAKFTVLPSGCWQWEANCQVRDGQLSYGLFKTGRQNWFAHRWAYAHWVGPIPDGQHLDHFCFPQAGCVGPRCVNPNHLRPAAPRENTLRSDAPPAWNLAKTHCPQGHPYAGNNLEIRKSGARRCRTCSRRESSAYYQRRRAA